MPITAVDVGSVESSTDGVAFSTGSIVPLPFRAYAVAVFASKSVATAVSPTLTGWGLTWEEITDAGVNNGADTRRLTWFMAITGATPTTGALTATWGGTYTGCIIVPCLLSGVVTASVGDAWKAGSAKTNNFNIATAPTLTMNAYGAATNGVIGACLEIGNNFGITPDPSAGSVEVYENNYANPAVRGQVQYNPGNDSPFTWTIDSPGSASLASAFELVGSVSVSGTALFTLGGLTLGAAGTRTTAGTAAVSLGGLTLAAAGTSITPVSGTAAITLGSLTLAASGTVTKLGTAALALGGLTLVAAGSSFRPGTAAIPLGGLTLTASGTRSTPGAAALALGALALTASGTRTTFATAALPLGALTLAATGTVIPPVTGVAAITLGGLTLAAAGTSVTPIPGAAAITLGALTLTAFGSLTPATYGVATLTLGPLTLTALGKVPLAIVGEVGGGPAINDNVDDDVFTSASLSPTASRWHAILVYAASASGGGPTPDVSATWGMDCAITLCGTTGVHARRALIYVFKTSASPGSGTLTLDFDGDIQSLAFATILETVGGNIYSNVATDFYRAANVITTVENSVTSLSLAMNAYGSIRNGVVSLFGIQLNTAMAPDGSSGTIETFELATSSPTSKIQGQFNPGNDTSVTSTWSGSTNGVGIGVELITFAGVRGTAAITLGPLTLTTAGDIADPGSAAVSLGPLTLTATGIIATEGTAALSLGGLTLTAIGAVAKVGTAALSLGPLILTATGTALESGTATFILGALTLTAVGVIGSRASITLPALTLAASGTRVSAGQASVALSRLSVTAVGTVHQRGRPVTSPTYALGGNGSSTVRGSNGNPPSLVTTYSTGDNTGLTVVGVS